MMKARNALGLSFYALFLALFTITLIPFNGLTYIMFSMMGNYMKWHRFQAKFKVDYTSVI